MRNSSELIYNLDASAFISMVHDYPRDVFPGLWKDMGTLADCGRLVMFELIMKECKDPSAQDWLKEHKLMIRGFSAEINDAMLRLQSDLSGDGQFIEDPKSGKSKADPWLIALTMAESSPAGDLYLSGNHVIICHEKETKNTSGKVKIPDVCRRYGIKCLGLIDIPAIEGWSY